MEAMLEALGQLAQHFRSVGAVGVEQSVEIGPQPGARLNSWPEFVRLVLLGVPEGGVHSTSVRPIKFTRGLSCVRR
jgi:hypothetical protein